MITLVFLAAKPESGRANRNVSTQVTPTKRSVPERTFDCVEHRGRALSIILARFGIDTEFQDPRKYDKENPEREAGGLEACCVDQSNQASEVMFSEKNQSVQRLYSPPREMYDATVTVACVRWEHPWENRHIRNVTSEARGQLKSDWNHAEDFALPNNSKAFQETSTRTDTWILPDEAIRD